MNAFLPVSLSLLCVGVVFLAIGIARNDTTFLTLGGVFMASAGPLLAIGLGRKRFAKTN
ncbi:hypothetical protein [Bordetella genomosp. 12]|uniref:hypothetical protein n=1 Tax=Bordetella genomosp. 12 TaxID=463035 RepID=UPI00142D81FC|nr:hypothetical protein [Bordetella genomosp. 12]